MVDLAGGTFAGYSAGAEPIRQQSHLVGETSWADRIHLMKKETKATTSQTYYIGLDVHKNSVSVGYAGGAGGVPEYYGKLGGSNQAVERGLLRLRKKLGAGKDDLRICYEAGPTGFVLARRLLQLGYDAIVVAPSKIPRKSGDRVKTDRKDAVKLAGLHRAANSGAPTSPTAVTLLCRRAAP